MWSQGYTNPNGPANPSGPNGPGGHNGPGGPNNPAGPNGPRSGNGPAGPCAPGDPALRQLALKLQESKAEVLAERQRIHAKSRVVNLSDIGLFRYKTINDKYNNKDLIKLTNFILSKPNLRAYNELTGRNNLRRVNQVVIRDDLINALKTNTINLN